MKKRIATINGKILTEGGSVNELSNNELKVETTTNGINIIDNKGNSLVSGGEAGNKAVEFIDVTNEISASIYFIVEFSPDYGYGGSCSSIVPIPSLEGNESEISLNMGLFDAATGQPLLNIIPYIKELRPYTNENGSTVPYITNFEFLEDGRYTCGISYEVIDGIAAVPFYGTVVFGFKMIK